MISGLDTNATVEIQFWLTGFQFPPATLCSKQNETGQTRFCPYQGRQTQKQISCTGV